MSMNPSSPRPQRPGAQPPPRPAPHPAPAPKANPNPAPPAPGPRASASDDAGFEATTYWVQVRLADSLPEGGVDAWRAEIEEAAARENLEELETRRRLARRIEQELNAGHGQCWFNQPGLSAAAAECLRATHGARYQLRAWVIMPNRVLAVVTAAPGADVMALVRQWKMAISREAGQRLDVDPRTFWDRGAFVKPCRDETDAQYRIRDVEFLPVNAGLCRRPRDWQWSSAAGPGGPAPDRPSTGRRPANG